MAANPVFPEQKPTSSALILQLSDHSIKVPRYTGKANYILTTAASPTRIQSRRTTQAAIMCQEVWTQYRDCNHEHVPMTRTIRCQRIDADVDPRTCASFTRRRREIKYPDMCNACRNAGATVDEGYKSGRWG